MATFTSSPTPSPFELNPLMLDSISGQYAQRGRMNDLMLQSKQQDISATDQEMVARAAAYLNGLPEDQRAASYGPIVQDLQGRGFAKQAPPQYPGHERIAALASMGTPSKETLAIGASQAAKSALYPGTTPGPGASAAPSDGAAGDGVFAANNPLNIRFVGQDGASNTRGFAAFPTPEAGQAATDKQFAAYAERGINTLTGLISRWAPPNENDTAGYIARVSKATGIDPNSPIDLRDPKQSRVIQQAMAGVEANKNGRILPLDGSAAPGGGVAGRIPGAFDVAGQPAAPASQAALLPNGLKPEQDRQMQVLRTTRGVTSEELLAAQEKFLASNRQEAAAARTEAERQYQHGRNTVADKQSAETAARLAEEQAMKPENLLIKYRDAMVNGTADEHQRLLYSIGAQHYLKPVPTWVDSVTEPGKKELVNLPGQLPEGFPPPTYRPNQAQPAAGGPEQAVAPIAPQAPAAPVAPAAAPVPGVPAAPTAPASAQPPGPYPWSVAAPPLVKSDQRVSKPLEVSDRKVLLDESKRLDQVVDARSTFKDNYGGYGSATIGDTVNAIARNTPGESQRADWWQNYQRIKLAARQSVSGQSLTESEKGEFEKADINPGMSAETIRANLKRQDDLLRIGLARHVRSLVGDNFSKSAVEEASGVKFDDTAFRAAGEGLGKSVAQPKSETEFNALPSGTVFIDPEGKRRRKP